jgi:hypothetical protein
MRIVAIGAGGMAILIQQGALTGVVCIASGRERVPAQQSGSARGVAENISPRGLNRLQCFQRLS